MLGKARHFWGNFQQQKKRYDTIVHTWKALPQMCGGLSSHQPEAAAAAAVGAEGEWSTSAKSATDPLSRF